MSESEEKPPDPEQWWRHRRYQSYIGIVGLIAISVVSIMGDVDTAATELLKYAGIGCAIMAVQYGLSNSLCDAIRAWRGNK